MRTVGWLGGRAQRWPGPGPGRFLISGGGRGGGPAETHPRTHMGSGDPNRVRKREIDIFPKKNPACGGTQNCPRGGSGGPIHNPPSRVGATNLKKRPGPAVGLPPLLQPEGLSAGGPCDGVENKIFLKFKRFILDYLLNHTKLYFQFANDFCNYYKMGQKMINVFLR